MNEEGVCLTINLGSAGKFLAAARLSLTWKYKVLRVDEASHWNECDQMPDYLSQRWDVSN